MVTRTLPRARSGALLVAALATLVAAAPSQAQPGPAPRAAPAASAPAASSASVPAAPAAPAASSAPSASALPTSSAAAPPSAPPAPRLHHAPVLTAPAHQRLVIQASMDFPDTIAHAWLVYRLAGEAEPRQAEFLRSTKGPYAAVIEGDQVNAPGFGYCIELELTDGQRRAVFASRDDLQAVSVVEIPEDAREQALLARLGGRRSVVRTSAEYVHFGTTDALLTASDGSTQTRSVADRYYRIEAGYTYRLLGTLSEFSLRGGVVRGRSLVPGQSDPARFDVGLNYGAPTLRLRAADWLHFEGELLTSVTEVGFSTGGGAAVLLGDPYGSKLTIGFESIQTFGTRFFSRLDLRVGRRVEVAPIVEVTDMPHADRFGVRLLTELALPLDGGFTIAGKLGYQARDFTSGGPSGGLSASYAF